jgi:hypothetical protein
MCIAIHDNMLAAALAVPRVLQSLTPQETLRARQYWYQAGNTPYPAWYFFGCKNKGVEGLVSLYSQQNFQVSLCPVSLLTQDIKATQIDVQFCALSSHLYQKLKQRNILISGYLPEAYASKIKQWQHIEKSGGNPYLPIQMFFRQHSEPHLPVGTRGIWILKAPHGSAGRDQFGNHYTVWKEKDLRKNLPTIIASLSPQEELICSEFIITDDPYAGGADHVVHKMHFSSSGKGSAPYGQFCQRFIHRCNWNQLHAAGVLSLPDFIGIPEITTGYVGSLNHFQSFAKTLHFHKGPSIFSADFMVPSDGIPRFLECNKLAATFAEQFDPALPPIIDYYASLTP